MRMNLFEIISILASLHDQKKKKPALEVETIINKQF